MIVLFATRLRSTITITSEGISQTARFSIKHRTASTQFRERNKKKSASPTCRLALAAGREARRGRLLAFPPVAIVSNELFERAITTTAEVRVRFVFALHHNR
jgi:hypothetical protein